MILVTVPPPCAPAATAGGTLYYVINPTSSSFPNYTCYAYTWVATESSATLSFFFRDDSSFWLLDDVSVYQGLTQMIINGGFETGDPTGWNYSGSCTTSPGAVSSGSSFAHSGNYFYYDACSNFGDTISQTFATIIGDTYDISFWLTIDGCCGTTVVANITLF
jgi:hypothetical protein